MTRILRILAVVAIIVAAAPQAFSQLRYGVRLGTDITTPNTEASDGGASFSGGAGFNGGLTLEWQNPNGGFAVGVSALYDHRKLKLTPAFMPDSPLSEKKIGADFIEVPIDIKYNFWLATLSNLAAPFITTGPDVAFRLNGPSEDSRTHFGWNLGAGFNVVNFIEITAGYRFGISKHYNESYRDSGVFINASILFDF